MHGGLTDTIFAVRTRERDPTILRFVRIDRWGEVGRRHVVAEAQGCTLLVGADLPVPRLIASDPTGAEAGDYVNLTTFLPVARGWTPWAPTRSTSWPGPR